MMNNLITSKPSMTSLEIAELVEKRHDNVKRTIEMLIVRGVITSPQIEEKPTDGRPYREGGLFHRWWLVTFINCEVLRRYQEPVALDRVLSEHHAALAAVPVEG